MRYAPDVRAASAPNSSSDSMTANVVPAVTVSNTQETRSTAVSPSTVNTCSVPVTDEPPPKYVRSNESDMPISPAVGYVPVTTASCLSPYDAEYTSAYISSSPSSAYMLTPLSLPDAT